MNRKRQAVSDVVFVQTVNILFSLVLILNYPLTVLAAGPSHEFKLYKTEKSKTSNIKIEYFYSTEKETRQVWLSKETDGSSQPSFLLYEFGRSANVFFSPDENWIVVNDFLASNIAEIHLFKRGEGLTYQEIKEPGVTGQVWDFLTKQNGHNMSALLGHAYIEYIQWSADSTAFIVKLWGHEDGQTYLDDWYCIYDVTKFAPTLDMGAMNRKSVHIGSTQRKAD